MPEKVIIYTDGSCLGNPGPGGIGVVLLFGNHRKEISQGYRNTTNNRMELLAVITALRALKKEGLGILLFTDSEYVLNAINKKWLDGWVIKKFKKIKNPDLWKEYLLVSKNHLIELRWVKAHDGNTENEHCDFLAKSAAQNPIFTDKFFEESLKNISKTESLF